MSPTSFRIAIIGAGPAGLTLGLLLHRHAIPFTIFELRPKPTSLDLAKPSGSLDLHEESGLAALKACDLLDEFMLLTGDCTEAQVIATKDGTIIYTDEGEGSHRPEISRHKLLQLLLSHLSASSIKWGHKLISAHNTTASTGHTEISLDFGPNGTQTFDLVIGADGTWSKVRALLTDIKPQYVGMHYITLDITQNTSQHPHLSDFIGTGTFTSLADHHGVISQRSVADSARIYIFISTSDEHFASTSGLDTKTPTQAKGVLLGDDAPFARWATTIKELIAVACDDESANNPTATLDIKPLYRLPIGHTWTHHPAATLIGDAAHLMNPGAGEGVNSAMLDALLLSRAIVKAFKMAGEDAASVQDALEPLIKEFEVDMWARAKEMAEETLQIGEMMFGGSDGSGDMAAWFRKFGESDE
ncbi:hypothetical protein PMZ80_008989 [Knufia obscura]|uniref:FAD-binding domain-containing protein n=2 Tax=Knufia TaxID=430999 RepID=A0AAN8I6U6_9EURO|nr:hypothetical protein PMZ80_008989 [Knufia obscura]KAK5955054.1 hypothetical protein OHC33_003733 [Knufia fluminis]